MDLWTKIGIGIITVFLGISLLRGCSDQGMARSYGGETEVTLEPNRKLIEITWKDDSLWYLTRAMTEDDIAEDYIFQEKDPIGVAEGTVIVHEVKMTEEEYQKYLESLTLKEDYYRTGNSVYNETTGEYKEEYIHYDMETDTYIKLKDYDIDETTGELIPKN